MLWSDFGSEGTGADHEFPAMVPAMCSGGPQATGRTRLMTCLLKDERRVADLRLFAPRHKELSMDAPVEGRPRA